MSVTVSLTDDAARDLDELYAHALLHGKPDEAEGLFDRIEVAFRTISESPESGRRVGELLDLGIHEYREVPAGQCRIFYRTLNEEVYVLLVADPRLDMMQLLTRRLLEP